MCSHQEGSQPLGYISFVPDSRRNSEALVRELLLLPAGYHMACEIMTYSSQQL